MWCCNRKIKTVLLRYARIKDLIMDYLRINLFLHVSINFIRWILKYLIHGKLVTISNMSLTCCKFDVYTFCYLISQWCYDELEFTFLFTGLLFIRDVTNHASALYSSLRCNILKRVPNSALWLLRFPAAGETRVRSRKYPKQKLFMY